MGLSWVQNARRGIGYSVLLIDTHVGIGELNLTLFW